MRESIWRLPWITCLVERANDYRCSKNVKQRWSYRRKIDPFFEICRKKSSEIGYFLLIVSWRSFPLKFPAKTADFSKNLPLKILRNLTFFPLKSRKIGRFFCEFCFFCREIGRFFREFSPENPVKFCFFFREISEALNWKVDFQKQYSNAKQ